MNDEAFKTEGSLWYYHEACIKYGEMGYEEGGGCWKSSKKCYVIWGWPLSGSHGCSMGLKSVSGCSVDLGDVPRVLRGVLRGTWMSLERSMGFHEVPRGFGRFREFQWNLKRLRGFQEISGAFYTIEILLKFPNPFGIFLNALKILRPFKPHEMPLKCLHRNFFQ